MAKKGIYIYDEDKLEFKRISLLLIIVVFLIFLIGTNLFTYKTTYNAKGMELLTMEDRVFLIKAEEDSFNEEKLREMLKDLNVLHPEIILAQSRIETGNFKSKIFLENNNLFGMKEAMMRARTAKGTQYGHAYYDTWRESVYDYALYQCRYLGKLKKQEDYLQYLGQSYAEDPEYIKKIKEQLKK